MESVKPDFLFQVVTLAVVVVPLLVGILSYNRGKNSQMREISPQPLVVAAHQEYVSKGDFKQEFQKIDQAIDVVEKESNSQIEALRREFKDDMEKANTAANHRAELIHVRINKLGEEMPMKIIEHLQHMGKLK